MTLAAPRRDDRRAAIGFWLLISMIVALGVGKAVRSDVMDPDAFWHIRVAEQLLDEGIGPIVDHLSYGSIKEPWTPYSWLAELGMKWVWDAGGFRWAVAIRAAIVGATLALVALGCLELARRGTPPYPNLLTAGPLPEGEGTIQQQSRRMCAVVGTALFAYLSLPYLTFRPATAAITLMALCAWLLLRDRRLDERSRAVWLVVPITALTVNLHLTAVVIPMWVAALLGGAVWERRNVRRYAVMLALTAAACLATPLLPGVIQTSLHYQSRDVMVASTLILEMQPIWRGDMALINIGVIALFLIAAIRGRKVLRAGEWLMLAVGLLLMLRLGRFAPLFGIIAGPIAAATMPNLPDKLLARTALQAVIAMSLLSFAYRVVEAFPDRNTPFCDWLNRPHLDFSYPCKAADWVDANVSPRLNSRSGRLINEFNWGGYLAWRLGPQFQTLLDGRTQMFTAEFWNSTLLAPDDQTKAAFLAQQNADVAILPVGRSDFRGALKLLNWQSAYRDGVAEVLLPPASSVPSTAPTSARGSR